MSGEFIFGFGSELPFYFTISFTPLNPPPLFAQRASKGKGVFLAFLKGGNGGKILEGLKATENVGKARNAS